MFTECTRVHVSAGPYVFIRVYESHLYQTLGIRLKKVHHNYHRNIITFITKTKNNNDRDTLWSLPHLSGPNIMVYGVLSWKFA